MGMILLVWLFSNLCEWLHDHLEFSYPLLLSSRCPFCANLARDPLHAYPVVLYALTLSVVLGGFAPWSFGAHLTPRRFLFTRIAGFSDTWFRFSDTWS